MSTSSANYRKQSDAADLVSVVIPSYNCAGSIGAVLDAVLAQTHPAIETLVINDASPDSLDSVIRPYLPRVNYIENKTNLGLSKTYNVGIRHSHGRYILTLHSDCVLEPDYVSTLLQMLKQDSSLAAVTGQYDFSDFSDMRLSDKLFTLLNLLPVNGSDRSTQGIHEIPFMEGKADLFRREILDRYGLFNESLSLTAEDQDIAVRMRKDGFRIRQNERCRFKVKYSGTQDSLFKVINKQRTYARGQAYVILSHGWPAFKTSKGNRERRALHRLGQLLHSFVLVMAAILSFFSPIAAIMLAIIICIRIAYYGFICRSLRASELLVAVIVGLLGDFFYSAGFLQGTILKIFRRKG